MSVGEVLGWAACVMTFATFVQRSMVPLRAAAILANVFFIGYAAIGHYNPVLALHLALLPINCQRLSSLVLDRQKEDRPSACDHASPKGPVHERSSSDVIAGLSGLS
jgi:predicted acyltransferase